MTARDRAVAADSTVDQVGSEGSTVGIVGSEGPTVGIVGAGRVGSAVGRALAAAGVRVVAVASRRRSAARDLAVDVGADVTAADEVFHRADLTLLTVSDGAIAGLAADLAAAWPARGAEPARSGTPTSPKSRGVTGWHTAGWRAVVHCSGALDDTPLRPLAEAGLLTGSWHPLQAFATADTPLAAGITWAVTAPPDLAAVLTALSRQVGGRPVPLAAADTVRYHAAAALASNYTVTLAADASRLLEGCGFSHDEAQMALLPLLRTTLEGVARHGLPGGLTGPLVRGDVETVRAHLAALTPYPDIAALYRALGRATVPLLVARGTDPAAVAAARAILGDAEPTERADEPGA